MRQFTDQKGREKKKKCEREREGETPRSQEISERILFFEIISLPASRTSLFPFAFCSPPSCLIFRPLRTQSEITHESC